MTTPERKKIGEELSSTKNILHRAFDELRIMQPYLAVPVYQRIVMGLSDFVDYADLKEILQEQGVCRYIENEVQP